MRPGLLYSRQSQSCLTQETMMCISWSPGCFTYGLSSVYVPGNREEGGTSSWGPAPIWETQKFLASTLRFAQIKPL